MHAFRFRALLAGRLTRLKDVERSKDDLISHYFRFRALLTGEGAYSIGLLKT